MSETPELVQFGDLTPHHFERHPVWVQCHIVDYDEPWYDETDEETFRPRAGPLPADPAEGMLLVRAEFTLADGSRLAGFMTPAVADGSDPEWQLGLVQPQVFMPAGGLTGFWEGGVAARSEAHEGFYRALGKSPAEVFPIRFRAEPGLALGVASGELRGFYSIPDGRTVRVTL